MPSYVHFISDLKDQYHVNIRTIQVDPKNPTARAYIMAGDQLNSDIYYIPEVPMEGELAEFPKLPDAFKRTRMYQLLLAAALMFDSLVHFMNDHYEWASKKRINMSFWRNELIKTLNSPVDNNPRGN